MYNQNTDDLRADALWRAGEPQSTSSSLWVKSLDYLNRIQQTLVLGGSIVVGRDLAASAGLYSHVFDLPITDWWWARKLAVLTTIPGQDCTITLTEGSRTATASGMTLPVTFDGLSLDFAGWRIYVPGQEILPKIITFAATSTGGAITLDAPWPASSVAGVDATLYKEDYALPPDFLRFTTPLWNHSSLTRQVPVGSREQFMASYGFPSIRQGPPIAVFQIGPQTLLMDSYDTQSYRLEYEYVALPAALETGTVPILPMHHRMVLSIGAAMLMCFDKSDTKAAELASEYREAVMRMTQEHRKAMSSGSNVYGQHLVRQSGFRRRAQQPSGEVFLT